MKGVAEAPSEFTGPASEPPPATAKLFMHGGSQAVRLPKAFRFEGKEVRIRKEGDAVILEPAARNRLPRTDEEIDAMFAEVDRLMAGRKLPYPPRETRERTSDPE